MRLPQDIAEQSEAARLKTVAAEFPSSEWSFDSNPNRAAVYSKEIQHEAPEAKPGPEKVPAGLQETQQSAGNDAKAGPANQTSGAAGEKAVPAAESMAAKSSDPVWAKAESTAAKPDPEKVRAGLEETLQGAGNDAKAAPANQTSGAAGEKAVPAAQSMAGKFSDPVWAKAEAPVAKPDPEKVPAGLQETQQGAVNDAKAAPANQTSGEAGEKAVPPAQSMAGKFSDPVWAKAEAPVAKPDPEKVPAGLQETQQSAVNDAKAAPANQTSGEAGEKAVPPAQSMAGKSSDPVWAKADGPAAEPDPAKIQAGLQETQQSPGNDAKAAPANQTSGAAGEKAVPAAQSMAGKFSDPVWAKADGPAAESDPAKIPAGLQETQQGAGNYEKAAPANQTSSTTGEKAVPAAQSMAGKFSDPVWAKAEAPSAKPDPEKVPSGLQETQQGAVNDAKAAPAVVGERPEGAGGKTAIVPESLRGPWRLDSSIEDFQSGADPYVFGAGTESGPSVHQSASAITGMDAPNVAESRTAFSGLDTAMLSKQIEKQLGSRDSAPESAVFQNSASNFQRVSEINLPGMENSTQNSFAYYDPYRSAELVQSMREQQTGGVARQLVLDMEPDELGKVSIRVGARKDEISVVAHTQSEPARQALMSRSPELRQDLQDQGLVLDKFMVDVNREKSGGGNYPEQNNPKGKTPPISRTVKVGVAQTAAGPSYVRKTDGRSRISIFA